MFQTIIIVIVFIKILKEYILGSSELEMNFYKLFVSIHNLDSPLPLFLKGEEVNFDYLPQSGRIWKFKNGGERMVQGQVFLIGEGLEPFLFNLLKVFIFTLRNYFTLYKILFCIWRIIFFCHHNFMKKKVILSCLKMNLKISYE